MTVIMQPHGTDDRHLSPTEEEFKNLTQSTSAQADLAVILDTSVTPLWSSAESQSNVTFASSENRTRPAFVGDLGDIVRDVNVWLQMRDSGDTGVRFSNIKALKENSSLHNELPFNLMITFLKRKYPIP